MFLTVHSVYLHVSLSETSECSCLLLEMLTLPERVWVSEWNQLQVGRLMRKI